MGRAFALFLASCFLGAAPATDQSSPAVLLAGTLVAAELETELATKTARAGDTVGAIIVKPVRSDGEVVLPSGFRLSGVVEGVPPAGRRRRITPWLRVAFNQINLPDGRSLPATLSFKEMGWGETLSLGKAGAVGTTATDALFGAGIGAFTEGRKGAAIGAGIGGGLTVLSEALLARARCNDV